MTLLKVLAVAAMVSMAGTPAVAAGAKANAAAKLSLGQPSAYPQDATQGQVPSAKAKSRGGSNATLPLALAGAAAVVGAALLLGKGDSSPASH
jgi:hypothetical protein